MLILRPLDHSNFKDFVELLRLRGDAPVDYYRWKYLDQAIKDKPAGFVAYFDGNPVGCIGNINRVYVDPNGKCHFLTWFADWYVNKEARSKGVGFSLLSGVASISPFGLGIPGPSKALNLAKSVGYGALNGYIDYIFLARPFRFGMRKYRSEIFIKAAIRGLFHAIKYHYSKPRNATAKFEILGVEEFVEKISGVSKSIDKALEASRDFLDWMSRIPPLPNGKKEYWHMVSLEMEAWSFGFIERDYKGLRRATMLMYNENSLNRVYLDQLLMSLSSNNIDYLHWFAQRVKKDLDPLAYSARAVPLVTLNDMSLRIFPIDRENVWFSQQSFT